MPNHVTQRLHIEADDKILTLIREKVNSEDHEFDANRIIAMPEMLSCTVSNGQVTDQKKSNVEKYGFPTWYEWANHWWGTKWGCYDSKWESDDQVTFTSAWSPAYRIVEALSTDFPEATFTLEYDGEIDHPGIVVIQAGEIVEEREIEREEDE